MTLPGQNNVLVTVLVGLLATAACSRPGPDPAALAALPQPPPDQLPERIVSQAIVADEILWELGPDVQRRVVAVSKFADEPRYGARAPWPPQVTRLGPHSEQLIALNPDLVIAASFSSPELRALLQRSEIPTILLSDFTGFDDYRTAADRIGRAVGATRRAEALLGDFNAALRQRSAGKAGKTPTVVSWVDSMVAGSETTFDDASSAAGMTNAAAAGGIIGHRRVPLELVISWDPDFFVTACGAAGCQAAVDRLREQPAVSATRAAQTGRIRAVRDRILFATGAGMLDLVSTLTEFTRESQ